jgi:type II secretory pathway component PulC
MITFFYITSEDEVVVMQNPHTPNARGAEKALNKTKSQVTETAQITRDPFAMVPQLTIKDSQIPISLRVPPGKPPENVPSSVPKSVSQKLKLTGIISTQDQYLAVIKSDEKTKYYSLNEFIGIDRIMAITNTYVILANGDSKTILHLEAAGQKGDHNSEK